MPLVNPADAAFYWVGEGWEPAVGTRCGNPATERALLIFVANGAPLSLYLSFFPPLTARQAALTMNQSLGGIH